MIEDATSLLERLATPLSFSSPVPSPATMVGVGGGPPNGEIRAGLWTLAGQQ